MELLSTLLSDLEPNCLVEIGGNLDDATWAPLAAFAAARVVRFEDRAHLVQHPEHLASELEALDTPFEAIVDHATDDVGATLRILEVTFGRLTPGGVYIVHGTLPSDVVLDLMFASAVSPQIVDGVSLTPSAVVLRRGEIDPGPALVTVADLRSDPFGVIPR